eukprot:5480260-Pyramimonas_sp.AAC.2
MPVFDCHALTFSKVRAWCGENELHSLCGSAWTWNYADNMCTTQKEQKRKLRAARKEKHRKEEILSSMENGSDGLVELDDTKEEGEEGQSSSIL